jgi:hypothetical protein
MNGKAESTRTSDGCGSEKSQLRVTLLVRDSLRERAYRQVCDLILDGEIAPLQVVNLFGAFGSRPFRTVFSWALSKTEACRPTSHARPIAFTGVPARFAQVTVHKSVNCKAG